jgi:L-histidine N-alpha-methyltransferase
VGYRPRRRSRELPQLGLPATPADLQRRPPGAGRLRGDATVAAIEILFPAAERQAALREEARVGLTSSPKELQPKWFYDERGSALFDEITRLPEYYLTRVERSILEQHVDEIGALTGAQTLIELGPGTSESKTRILLDALEPQRFIPFDVSEETLRASASALAAAYPRLEVVGVVGDFERHLPLLRGGDARRLLAFLGSTIGNLPPEARAPFLTDAAAVLGENDSFLLGVDLVKARERLEPAYDDAAGVTRQFNLNALCVLNRELDADFDVDAFEHVARWDAQHEWMEMSVRSLYPQTVRLMALELEISFDEGELMRTEISAKFRRRRIGAELAAAGFEVARWWTDAEGDFALVLATPGQARR